MHACTESRLLYVITDFILDKCTAALCLWHDCLVRPVYTAGLQASKLFDPPTPSERGSWQQTINKRTYGKVLAVAVRKQCHFVLAFNLRTSGCQQQYSCFCFFCFSQLATRLTSFILLLQGLYCQLRSLQHSDQHQPHPLAPANLMSSITGNHGWHSCKARLFHWAVRYSRQRLM